MDFYNLLTQVYPGWTVNPYASRTEEGWIKGEISIDFLNANFSEYKTAEEMKNATESEGLRLYFDWLKEKGILD